MGRWDGGKEVAAGFLPAGRGDAGKEGPALQFLSFPLAAFQVQAWLEGLLLPPALAEPALYFKDALLRRPLGCYVADCV